jgi:NAD-dependent SIR2 family protein deacetylase
MPTTSTRKKADFPPKSDAPPDTPGQAADDASANAAPEEAAGITYAFDYANGTFFVTDDGTGQWVDPAGSTFTFSAGDDSEEEPDADDEATAPPDDDTDPDAPPWAKKSMKVVALESGPVGIRYPRDNDPNGKYAVTCEHCGTVSQHTQHDRAWSAARRHNATHPGGKKTAAVHRCNNCGGPVEPENVDPDWGDLQLCKSCEHRARSRLQQEDVDPNTDPNADLARFREMHAPREEEPSGEWLDRHSKKTAANPFLPENTPFAGAGNPYSTPARGGPDAMADAETSLLGDEVPSAAPPGMPTAGPGAPVGPRPPTHPGGVPGGSQTVQTAPQTSPAQMRSPSTMASRAIPVICESCGSRGEVSLASLAKIGPQGEIHCGRCGSIEVEAWLPEDDEEAENSPPALTSVPPNHTVLRSSAYPAQKRLRNLIGPHQHYVGMGGLGAHAVPNEHVEEALKLRGISHFRREPDIKNIPWRFGSIEAAFQKEADEDFTQFSTPRDEPGGGTMSLPFGELHEVGGVGENARCSHCFHVFPHTAANPSDPVPPCPRCGSPATTVAGSQTKGASKLETMIAVVRQANPGLAPTAARKLAERALVLTQA